MTVNTVGHFLVHKLRMWLSMTGLTLRNIWMLAPVAEGTGKCLVFGLCFRHQFPNFPVTWHAECSWCGLRCVDLQWMVGRMASQTIGGHLTLGMGLMTIGTIRNLAMGLVAEGTRLLGMGAYIVGKILPRTLMTSKTSLLDIIGQVQGKGFMWIGMAGKAIFQFEVGLSLMTNGALRNNILPPWWMLLVTIQTGYRSLVLAAVAGYRCRRILVTLQAVCHI